MAPANDAAGIGHKFQGLSHAPIWQEPTMASTNDKSGTSPKFSVYQIMPAPKNPQN
jgi:hypothetical protein